jgi:lambda family phage minor tail protein L
VHTVLRTWRYRDPEGCGYAGGAVAKVDDTATTDLAQDDCSRRVSGCKLRFGATAELPIGIFPGAGVLRQL